MHMSRISFCLRPKFLTDSIIAKFNHICLIIIKFWK